MASTIKVDNVQNQPGTNIINKCSVTTTIGAGAGETIKACAATVTLGRCGGTVALASGATQTGFGRTGTVDWITTPKVTGDSPVTGVTGKGYFMNTTAGTITLNLPAGAAGSIVSVADYARTFATYNCTVSPNGAEKIGGIAASTELDVNGQSATFVYVDGTEGWINIQETETSLTGNVAYMSATGGTPCSGAIVCTNYKVHTFTGPGTFCVSAVSVGFPESVARNTVDFLVVAGGGGGGGSDGGGGAGSGGYRESSGTATGCYTVSPIAGTAAITATASPYSIVVGGGGIGAAPPGVPGGQGNTSTFSIISSAGGGGGGAENSGPPSPRAGGCGGGGGGGANAGLVAGEAGAGNTPPVSPPQGKCGGNAYPTTSPPAERNGGGGGGAITGGSNGTSPSGGPGGAGGTSSINATPTARAGGGGGGGAPTKSGGTGGTGGGGAGATFPGSGTVGTVNTGGGGGGSSPSVGVAGGSGIVILRYKFQ